MHKFVFYAIFYEYFLNKSRLRRRKPVLTGNLFTLIIILLYLFNVKTGKAYNKGYNNGWIKKEKTPSINI